MQINAAHSARGSLTHPNDPSTQQPIHTRASSNHRMGACEARGHAYTYDLTCSPAPRDSTSKQQTTPRQRASARIRPSPARRRCCSSCAAAGWWPWCLCWLGLTVQEQQERLAARPQVGQRRQAEHGGFRRHPSQSRHRGTPLHSAQSSASVGFELVEVLPTDRRRHPAACHSADTANGCPGCTSCRKHRTPRAARRAGQGGLLSACLSVLSQQAHA